ncbi:putative atp-dependent endonuclease of the old family [hydrocarbon metagenome]|uniref:Putative atp-dependent endonuclease of the old family n=1 Tax=hydrocarbon metagenome TaxID=938273 RepID=A0A0W8F8B0_9ZZZZ
MYISRIRIQNYRCFQDNTINFNQGLNIIIGENNAGKTTVLKALQLVFNRPNTEKPTVEDFYRKIPSLEEPPEIKITVTIKETPDESPTDKAVIATWLTKISSPWEATLTYKFFLPEININKYKEIIKYFKDKKNNNYFDLLEKFLPKYVSRIYAGNPDSMNKAELEWLEKFDCRLLGAFRDVESEMLTGRNPLLKQVLNYFLDFDLRGIGAQSAENIEQQNQRHEEFSSCSQQLILKLNERLDIDNILKATRDTGASVGGEPFLGGKLEEGDAIAALKLMIRKSGIEIPIVNNGLGYNNLIYISLVLCNLDLITSQELGDNAKIFPMLLIEEPEAHLHPALQYNFLRFLRKSIENKSLSRQIFITTHSTHITAAVDLDSIICMTSQADSTIKIAYPSSVFSQSEEDLKSKKYVERYLDATKSNMLFSKGIIFAEGITEQLLLPCLAEYLDKPLEVNHVAIVRVDGVTFKHFIKLFGGVPEAQRSYALIRNVSCLLDTDPSKREKNKPRARWNSCWPFEIGISEDNIYREKSGVILALEGMSKSNNIKLFYNKTMKGRTFEYDFAFDNSDCDLVIDETFELSDDEELIQILDKYDFTHKSERKRAHIAASYLIDIEKRKNKGENAFDLERRLRENLRSVENRKTIHVPDHIKDAISWACGEAEP